MDVLIHNINGSLSFSIFKKPTHSGNYLHYFSKHPNHMKFSVAIGQFLRIFRISSEIHQKNDIANASEILKRNGYPEYFVQKALLKAKSMIQNPNPRVHEESDNKRVIIPYQTSLDKKKWLLKSAGIDLVFSYPNSIKKTMIQRKHIVPGEKPNDNPGIYMIECLSCPKKYIGETGRTVTTRLKEHKNYLKSNLQDNSKYLNTAVVQHRALNHELDMKNAGIIYKSNSQSIRWVLESSLIQNSPNFNIASGNYSVDPVTVKILSKAVPRLPWPE